MRAIAGAATPRSRRGRLCHSVDGVAASFYRRRGATTRPAEAQLPRAIMAPWPRRTHRPCWTRMHSEATSTMGSPRKCCHVLAEQTYLWPQLHDGAHPRSAGPPGPAPGVSQTRAVAFFRQSGAVGHHRSAWPDPVKVFYSLARDPRPLQPLQSHLGCRWSPGVTASRAERLMAASPWTIYRKHPPPQPLKIHQLDRGAPDAEQATSRCSSRTVTPVTSR